MAINKSPALTRIEILKKVSAIFQSVLGSKFPQSLFDNNEINIVDKRVVEAT